MANVKHENKVYMKNLNINTRWDMTYVKHTHTNTHTPCGHGQHEQSPQGGNDKQQKEHGHKAARRN